MKNLSFLVGVFLTFAGSQQALACGETACTNLDFAGAHARLERSGMAIEIRYTTALPAQAEYGITPGFLIFKGTLFPDGGLGGLAYSVKKGCKPFGHVVMGRPQNNDLILYGRVPEWSGCVGREGALKTSMVFHDSLAPNEKPPAPIVHHGAGVIHNGSIMAIERQDDDVTITYVQPRGQLEEIGVDDGSVVFKGGYNIHGDVMGTAYMFKAGCSPASYPVVGEVSGTALELRGNPPVRAGCTILKEDPKRLNSKLIFSNLPRFMGNFSEWSNRGTYGREILRKARESIVENDRAFSRR